jgi:hypothetical protein
VRKYTRIGIGPISRKKQVPKEYPVEPEIAAVLRWHRRRMMRRQGSSNASPLNFESESYTLNRMQPFFNPGPLECGPPPILMGAVGPIMTRAVGAVGDMLQTHPTNSEARFVREVTRPRLEEGRKRSVLEEPVTLLAGPLIATGRDQVAIDAALKSARETLVFTLSTPAYWPVLEYHGWLELGHRLRDLTRAGAWDEMDAAVSDEIADRRCADRAC